MTFSDRDQGGHERRRVPGPPAAFTIGPEISIRCSNIFTHTSTRGLRLKQNFEPSHVDVFRARFAGQDTNEAVREACGAHKHCYNSCC
jgi:hypothetical protein